MNTRLRLLVDLAIAIAIAAIIWIVDLLLGRIAGVMTDILIAVLVAYLLFPVVHPLSRRMPRALAVLLVYVVLIGLIGAAIAAVGPTLAHQAQQLATDFPQEMSVARDRVSSGTAPIPYLGPLEPALRSLVATYAARTSALAGAAAGVVGSHAFGIVRGSARIVIDTVVILLLAFFFITDVERIRALVLRFFPPRRRPAVDSFLDDSDRVIGGFVRGQILLAIAVGILATIVLLVTGVRYAALLGALVGLFSVVPLVGPILGAVPAVAVALFTAGAAKALIVLVLFVIVFEVQGHVLTPVVIGRAVGVTPLVIFLAILIGAEARGVLGMLLAVPLAGIARVALDRILPPDPHRAIKNEGIETSLKA